MAKTTRMLTAGLVAMVVMGGNRPAAAQNLTVTLRFETTRTSPPIGRRRLKRS